MKNYKVLVILVISLAVLNVFSLGFIWYSHINKQHSERFVPHDRKKTERLLKENIGLSEKQIGQFRKARKMHFEKVKPLELELRENKKRLYVANVNNQKIGEAEPILRRIGQLQMKIDSLNYIHFSELRSYCDESQVENFDKMLSKMLRKEFGRKPERFRKNRN